MGCYAVLERGEGLAAALRGPFGVPVALTQKPKLLVVSPRASKDGLEVELHCGTVLLPGDAGGLLNRICAQGAVSYGLSCRDSITLSSRKQDRIWVAVQRELVRMDGTVLERQEISVPLSSKLGVMETLAVTGAALLLGSRPEEIGNWVYCV